MLQQPGQCHLTRRATQPLRSSTQWAILGHKRSVTQREPGNETDAVFGGVIHQLFALPIAYVVQILNTDHIEEFTGCNNVINTDL